MTTTFRGWLVERIDRLEFAAKFAGEEWPDGPAWQEGEDGEPVTTSFVPFKTRLLELSRDERDLEQLREAFNAWRNAEAAR